MNGYSFSSPNPRVRSTLGREGNPSDALCQCAAMRRSPAILRRWVSRFRAESAESAADPHEVSVIG